MKTKFFVALIFAGSLGLIPPVVADNEFCNIQENLKIQEELIKDDVVLIEFLKVFPGAELTRANFVQWSNPEQTSMIWTAGVYSLAIHIWGFDTDNPSNCFVPGGYRLNAPHLPEMTGSDYHHDSKIVLEQIEELEPRFVKGGPFPMLEEPEPPVISDEQQQMLRDYCLTGIRHPDMIGIPQCIKNELVCGPGYALADGVCQKIITEEHTRMEPSVFLDGFMFLLVISPFFIPGSIIFIVLSKTPRYSKGIIITVCIPATIVVLYFLWGLIVGWYPLGYA